MSLPSNMFANKLAPKLPHRIPKSPPFCSLVWFLIDLATPFSIIIEYSRALIIFITSFISLFAIISVVVLETCIFFRTPESIANAAAGTANGAKKFLPTKLLLSLIGQLFYSKIRLKTDRLSFFRYLHFRQLYISRYIVFKCIP